MYQPTRAPRLGMWEQVTEFLFDNNTIAGIQFENWMWLIVPCC
jgi:hypothetical protein